MNISVIDIDECDAANGANRCGANSICINTPGAYTCHCKPGFTGNAFKGCLGIIYTIEANYSYIFVSMEENSGEKIVFSAPCEDVKCGPHAYCKADGSEAYCICEEGWTFNPGDISAGCVGKRI